MKRRVVVLTVGIGREYFRISKQIIRASVETCEPQRSNNECRPPYGPSH